MREKADRERIEDFMMALGRAANAEGRVYFTGGACAVLLGWRRTTIDIDVKLDPPRDRLFQAISEIKEELRVNVDLANPGDFIPELPDCESRRIFISQQRRLTFYHYDFYSQALAKLERGHTQDLEDVRHMIERGIIDRPVAFEYFKKIEPWIYRYPAIATSVFRKSVEKALKD